MTKDAIRAQMRDNLTRHPALNNPFLTLLAEEQDPERLREMIYAWMQWQEGISFVFTLGGSGGWLKNAIMATPNDKLEVLGSLAHNLWQEAGQGNPEWAHYALLERLMEEHQVPTLSPRPQPVRNLMDRGTQICSLGTDLHVILLFMYFAEGLATIEYGEHLHAAAVRAGFSEEDRRFFAANEEADAFDGGHACELEELFLSQDPTEYQFRSALATAIDFLTLKEEFYQGLFEVVASPVA